MKYQVGLISLLLACQGENVIEKQSNSAPVVMIGSHSPSAEILEGYVETFRAVVIPVVAVLAMVALVLMVAVVPTMLEPIKAINPVSILAMAM